jgi:hypothetical protein
MGKTKVLFLICMFWGLIIQKKALMAQEMPPSVKVHFIYGSKPTKACKSTESKWLGGKKGGHVGIEYADGQVVHFGPKGKFHWVAQKRRKHSGFKIESVEAFYRYFNTPTNQLKRGVVEIPATAAQIHLLDSLAHTFAQDAPFDYAFLGMRCAAAADYLLAQTGIAPSRGRMRIALASFYPKLLRKRLLRKAKRQHWTVLYTEGSQCRNWETDKGL